MTEKNYGKLLRGVHGLLEEFRGKGFAAVQHRIWHNNCLASWSVERRFGSSLL
jgi:hypothetical protein